MNTHHRLMLSNLCHHPPLVRTLPVSCRNYPVPAPISHQPPPSVRVMQLNHRRRCKTTYLLQHQHFLHTAPLSPLILLCPLCGLPTMKAPGIVPPSLQHRLRRLLPLSLCRPRVRAQSHSFLSSIRVTKAKNSSRELFWFLTVSWSWTLNKQPARTRARKSLISELSTRVCHIFPYALSAGAIVLFTSPQSMLCVSRVFSAYPRGL